MAVGANGFGGIGKVASVGDDNIYSGLAISKVRARSALKCDQGGRQLVFLRQLQCTDGIRETVFDTARNR